MIKVFDEKYKVFVLRIARDNEVEIRMAIATVVAARKSNISIRTLHICGCARTCKDRLGEIFKAIVRNDVDSEGAEKAALREEYETMISGTDL
jgi:RNase P/RNase MRP subunit POP5